MNTVTIPIRKTFRESWQLTKKHIWLFTAMVSVMAILYFLIEVLTGNIDRYILDFDAAPALSLQEMLRETYSLKAIGIWALSSLLLTFFGLGLTKMSLQVVDGVEPGPADFASSPKRILHCFLAQLIYSIVVFIGMVFCILPGMLLMARLQFYIYFIVEEDCNAIEALSKTWDCTKGKTWKLLGFTLFYLAFLIVSVLLLVVGFFFAIPIVIVACALVYRKLRTTTVTSVAFESL